MTNKEGSIGLDPERQEKWKEIAGVNQKRYPRIGEKDVIALVAAAWPPTVFLLTDENTTDIVIRFPGSPRQLSPDHQRVYFAESRTLPTIFDEAISKSPAAGENTMKHDLMTQGYRAYKKAWLHFFESFWRNRTHSPDGAPKWFRDVKEALEQKGSPGKPKNIAQGQTRARFDHLLGHTQRLHDTIREYLAGKPTLNRGYLRDIVRTFWRDISKIPGGHLILGGEAFATIPYGKQDEPTSLADPSTWNARQLTIALLAIETGQEYQTVERKFPARKRK